MNSIIEKVKDIMEDKKVHDISVYNISKVLPIADYFIVGTIESLPQSNALLDKLKMELKQDGITQINRKQITQKDWILLDFNEFIIHLFTKESRMHYGLDNLWKKHIVE